MCTFLTCSLYIFFLSTTYATRDYDDDDDEGDERAGSGDLRQPDAVQSEV